MHYFGKFFVSSQVNDIIYTIAILLVSIIFAYCIKKLIIVIQKKFVKVV